MIMSKVIAYAICACCLLGCASSIPRPYLEAKAAGHRAYSSGRYEQAAEHFHQAAGKADRRKDRDEALYLEASSYLRAGRYREAKTVFEAMVSISPDGLRAARAAHEAAKIEIRHGDAAKGWQMLHAAIVRYPASGLSRAALQRYLQYLDETIGPLRVIDYLDASMDWYRAHDLGERALYEKAKRLERLGRLREAVDTLLICAKDYPYPVGSLRDNALYLASELEERLGRPRQAVAHLRTLLEDREQSLIHGSYERPLYAPAQMRLAVLYRDALAEPDVARKEFRKLFDAFPTSTLRDDALWAEALVARKQKDTEGACAAVSLLVKHIPQSRYAHCATLLCDKAPTPGQAGTCREYIARDIAP